jgi:acyl-CoA thioester hydrolase
MSDFRQRVLTTRERVKFATADPYGHLASGAYVDMIMSHRVEALQDLVGYSIVRSANDGVVFPARNIEVAYLRPALVGDELQVASWIDEIGTSSFEVRAIVTGATDRRVRALARIHFVTVDAKNGRTIAVPGSLPSSFATNALATLPRTEEYLATVTGIPEGWYQADVVPTTPGPR